jgi:hypothetical protein
MYVSQLSVSPFHPVSPKLRTVEKDGEDKNAPLRKTTKGKLSIFFLFRKLSTGMS